MGLIYEHLRDFPKALQAHQTALSLVLNFYGEHHPKTLITLAHLASAYLENKEYDKALATYQKIHKSPSKTHDPILINNIGMAYLRLENYEQAIAYFLKALKI